MKIIWAVKKKNPPLVFCVYSTILWWFILRLRQNQVVVVGQLTIKMASSENWFCTYCKTVKYVEIKYIYTYKNIFFYQFIFFFTFSSRRQETSDTINWTQNLQLTGLIPHQPTTGHCYWTRRCPGSAKRGCGHWIGRVVQSGRGQGMSHFTDNVLNLAWREHSSVLKLVKWCQHVSGRRNTEVTQLCPPSVWPMTGLVKPPDAPQ